MKKALLFSGLAVFAFSAALKAEETSVLAQLETTAPQVVKTGINVGKYTITHLGEFVPELEENEKKEVLDAITQMIEGAAKGAEKGAGEAANNLTEEQVAVLKQVALKIAQKIAERTPEVLVHTAEAATEKIAEKAA